jgi:hypothetical protein
LVCRHAVAVSGSTASHLQHERRLETRALIEAQEARRTICVAPTGEAPVANGGIAPDGEPGERACDEGCSAAVQSSIDLAELSPRVNASACRR